MHRPLTGAQQISATLSLQAAATVKTPMAAHRRQPWVPLATKTLMAALKPQPLGQGTLMAALRHSPWGQPHKTPMVARKHRLLRQTRMAAPKHSP